MFGTPLADCAPVVEQFLLNKHFRGDLRVFPRVYTDDELRQVKAPTLVLLGEREVIYDPRAALRRAETLMPNVVTALVPGAGHALVFDRPELINERLLAFLAP